MNILILSAFPEEQDYYKKILNFNKSLTIGFTKVLLCQSKHTNIYLATTGMGTINAALVTATLALHLNLYAIFFSGTAGAICPQLNIGDVVIGESAFDADILSVHDTVIGTPFEGALINPNNNKKTPRIFSANATLLKIAIPPKNFQHGVFYGKIATSNHFPAPISIFEQIKALNPMVIDMESAAIYQFGWLTKLPVLVIRCVSNKLNENGVDDNVNNSDISSSDNAAKLVISCIERIKNDARKICKKAEHSNAKSIFVSYKGGSGQALVLFHGWGFTSKVWQPIIGELIQNYAVYVVDLPGFGKSKLIEWDKFKAILFSSLPDNFMLVGWSMGGGYGIQLASEHPEKITNLVCIGASPKFIKDSTWPGIEEKFFDEFCHALEKDPIATLKEFVKSQSGRELDLDLENLPNKKAMQIGLQLLKTWDLRHALTKVTNACFMFGRLDKVIPVTTLKIMQQQYPAFDYVLFKNDAHMPFLSNQKIFLHELRRVLDV